MKFSSRNHAADAGIEKTSLDCINTEVDCIADWGSQIKNESMTFTERRPRMVLIPEAVVGK